MDPPSNQTGRSTPVFGKGRVAPPCTAPSGGPAVVDSLKPFAPFSMATQVRISIFGGAAGEIGGNRILLSWDGAAWLLDFGTRFGAVSRYFEGVREAAGGHPRPARLPQHGSPA